MSGFKVCSSVGAILLGSLLLHHFGYDEMVPFFAGPASVLLMVAAGLVSWHDTMVLHQRFLRGEID
ncbi:MAG: hypothetical protein ACRYG4_01280 [Janthinobacterium lividum]